MKGMMNQPSLSESTGGHDNYVITIRDKVYKTIRLFPAVTEEFWPFIPIDNKRVINHIFHKSCFMFYEMQSKAKYPKPPTLVLLFRIH